MLAKSCLLSCLISPGAHELPKVAKKHEIRCHHNPKYITSFEINWIDTRKYYIMGMSAFTCSNEPDIEVKTSSPLSKLRKTHLKKRKAQQAKKRGTQQKKHWRRQGSTNSSRRSAWHKRSKVQQDSISDSEKCNRKRRLITMRKLDETIVELESVTDCNILSEVNKVNADGVHLSTFPVRGIWKHIRDSPALSSMINHFKRSFINLYKINFKGKDKYTRFLLHGMRNFHKVFLRSTAVKL